MRQVFRVKRNLNGTERLELVGRTAWALTSLVKAGDRGCTPIDTPGPRWSAYVHILRHQHELDIETKTERHKGAFPGTHARYVLNSEVSVVMQAENEAAVR